MADIWARFARGRSTKAMARFEALLRVMLWQYCIQQVGFQEAWARSAGGRLSGSLGALSGRLVLRADRRHPSGLAQGRVAGQIVRMIPPLALDAHLPGIGLGGTFFRAINGTGEIGRASCRERV